MTDSLCLETEECWTAVLARDRAFDGRFVTGVLTTGIYCRPSCAARHPKRENVRFFADGAAARAAGLRACLRCSPDDVSRDEKAVLAAIAAIKAAEQPLALGGLAADAGYSVAHFQRVFSRHTGLSPSAYARALRAERAAEALSGAAKVTDAIYDAGYSAPSRFYDNTRARLGMAPSAWANGGKGATIHWAVARTSLGAMLVAATPKGVCRLSFNEGRGALEARFPQAELVEGGADFARLLEQVIAAVEAPGDFAHIPLDVKGTAFQEAVWRELQRIPKGETRTYAQLAAAVGKPKAVRAAGSANGANNVAVLIPCHRVIRTGGGLGGYAYGLEIKRKLLEKEEK
jgi:AraC family transcriptional regulator of adaptative response/methylated-DNA-[protein]-cysteine methyltransferase